jgi:LysR family transcriptional activator of nhaA
MRHLNYTHLLYFWTVAREGTIARASEVLHLTPQTISGQLKKLEESVGEPLFGKAGRGLTLTETGHIVNQYADEIFQLGAELTQRVRSEQALVPTVLNVGIVNSIPKLIAQRVLQPALTLDDPIKIVCKEGDLEPLLADLAVHRLDLVISDRPLPTGTNVKAYNHALGTSTVSFFAHKSIAKGFKKFPESLNGAPVLMPGQGVALRRALDDLFEQSGVTPRVVAEFDDSALLKAFGEAGLGAFPAPTAIADEVCSMYHSRLLGTLEKVQETFFAISPERKLKHPAVLAITETARDELFSTSPDRARSP